MIPQDERERDRDRDHDLLVRLDTKLDALSIQFSEARTALALKADLTRVEKLENCLDDVRKKTYTAMGGLTVLQFGLHFFLK